VSQPSCVSLRVGELLSTSLILLGSVDVDNFTSCEPSYVFMLNLVGEAGNSETIC
jgi:hypothetical protein